VTIPTVLHPSPEDLLDALSDTERVAVDLLLARHEESLAAWHGEESIRERSQAAVHADSEFCALVSDPKRRNYLVGLVVQVRQLGRQIRPRAEDHR
jgi:hypothetical protein